MRGHPLMGLCDEGTPLNGALMRGHPLMGLCDEGTPLNGAL